jgi:bifunctional DNA-binding transcriptional regulator/antitoxin component of YhaV-PrlF toxin-antitoxin module
MKPYGPYAVTRAGQVSVPKDLRARLGLPSLGEIYFILNPADPATLVLVPLDHLADFMVSARQAGTKAAE